MADIREEGSQTIGHTIGCGFQGARTSSMMLDEKYVAEEKHRAYVDALENQAKELEIPAWALRMKEEIKYAKRDNKVLTLVVRPDKSSFYNDVYFRKTELPLLKALIHHDSMPLDEFLQINFNL